MMLSKQDMLGTLECRLVTLGNVSLCSAYKFSSSLTIACQTIVAAMQSTGFQNPCVQSNQNI
jgi:hypothetical protein